jgi:hypothetical protein
MALPILPILAGAQAAIGAGQGIASLFRGNRRPTYTPSQEDMLALQTARMEYLDREAAGERQMYDQLATQFANAMDAGQDSGNIDETLPSLFAEYQKGARQIGAQSAQEQRQDIQNYQTALSQIAQKRDLQFQMNQFAPWRDAYNERREMAGAGMENLLSGLLIGREFGVFK